MLNLKQVTLIDVQGLGLPLFLVDSLEIYSPQVEEPSTVVLFFLVLRKLWGLIKQGRMERNLENGRGNFNLQPMLGLLEHLPERNLRLIFERLYFVDCLCSDLLCTIVYFEEIR